MDAGLVEPNALAESVKTPVTIRSAVSDQVTEAADAPALGCVGGAVRVIVRVELVAVRLEESVTVTTYVCAPFAHTVESHRN